mgnify:CR=1 FL=1
MFTTPPIFSVAYNALIPASLNDFVINNNQTLLLGLQSNQIKTKDEDTFFGIAKFEGSRVINSLLAGYTGKKVWNTR